MILLFWDASALIKRYFPEEGSDIADALFAIAQPHEMLTCPWGYAETYSLLVRRWNERVLNDAAFNTAVTALRNEVVDGLRFDFLPITDITIFESISITKKHSLNATDAAILQMLTAYAEQQKPTNTCVLIASDRRFLRAANNEGLKTLNPQMATAADIQSLLSP